MKNKKKTYDYARFGYFFSIPFMITWLVFQFYPIVYTFLIAFTDLKGAGNTELHFLWTKPFANFVSILKNGTFRLSFTNTVMIWTLNFIPQILLALLITAWFTDRRTIIKGQGVYKVLFYLPNIITQATIALLFATLFQYPRGVVNDLFLMLGINPDVQHTTEFLRYKGVARGIIVFIQTWMWYGYTSIILISGVLGISPELFEAAEVDGANGVQTFFKITIPSIKSILLFTLVTSLIGGLNMFDIPKVFLNGQPDNSTSTTSLFIYDLAFGSTAQYAKASAASIIMFIVIVVLSAILFYMLRDKDEVELRKQIRAQEKEFKRKNKGL